MQTLETRSTVISFPANDAAPPEVQDESGGNYGASRYNAMIHGILSKLTVLPHEDAGEYDAILAALVEEHRPSGPTERYLVEQLAGCMWRSPRVLLAEGATINRTLKSVAINKLNSPIPAAVPFERGLSADTDLTDSMMDTPEQVEQSQREALADLQATERARALLRKGGPRAYDRALKALLPDNRDWWQDCLDGEEYPADAAGLKAFIGEHLYPHCIVAERQARHHEAIRAQTLGEGLQAQRLEKTNRYEVHLDRKFERTLAILVKLQEMRGGRGA